MSYSEEVIGLALQRLGMEVIPLAFTNFVLLMVTDAVDLPRMHKCQQVFFAASSEGPTMLFQAPIEPLASGLAARGDEIFCMEHHAPPIPGNPPEP